MIVYEVTLPKRYGGYAWMVVAAESAREAAQEAIRYCRDHDGEFLDPSGTVTAESPVEEANVGVWEAD